MQLDSPTLILGTRKRSQSPRQVGSIVAVLLAATTCSSVQAQQPQQSPQQRFFAPGVLVTIPAEIEPDELVSTHDIVEIRADAALEWQPQLLPSSSTLYGMAEDVKFRRAVWCLEFAFKPLRMIDVPVPQLDGTSKVQRVWYLVYRVRNTGAEFRPTVDENGSYHPQPGEGGPVRFIPQFVLEGRDLDASGRRDFNAYLDQVIPAAMEEIRRRETPGRELLDSVEMAARTLPVSSERSDESVWGVAMWTGVDPRTDFFAVYVGGLTNAYRWVDPPGAYKLSDRLAAGRQYFRKMLQLNFWRPGDEYLQHEKEIRFGVPPGKSHLYDVPEGVAYAWVYR